VTLFSAVIEHVSVAAAPAAGKPNAVAIVPASSST
jgi:hypothetical protein